MDRIRLVSVTEMQQIERQADASGLSYAEMMQRAGKGLALVIRQDFEAFGMDQQPFTKGVGKMKEDDCKPEVGTKCWII